MSHSGWLGGDDDTWLRIAGVIGLAIDPILVDADDDMVVMMSMPGNGLVRAAPALLGAHPNPFNRQTMFEFSLPQAMPVELAIYDVRGQLVRRLVSGHQEAGLHSVGALSRPPLGISPDLLISVSQFVLGSVVLNHSGLLLYNHTGLSSSR